MMSDEITQAISQEATDAQALPIDVQVERATAIHQRYGDLLMRMPHVVGVGVGFVTCCGERLPEVGVVVMVDQKLPESSIAPDALIPRSIDGVRIDVQQSGVFHAGTAG